MVRPEITLAGMASIMIRFVRASSAGTRTMDGSSIEESGSVAALFRKRCVQASRRNLLGQVCVVTPPATATTLMLALLSIVLLAAAAYIVEVPQRTRAIGVLMPAGGLLKVIATGTGRITELAVKEGTTVTEGQLLLRISSDLHASDQSAVSESQLRSLEVELDLIDRAHAQEQQMKSSAAIALEKRLTLSQGRLAKAAAELDLQSKQVQLLEQRYEQMSVLVAQGSLAADKLAQERSGILHAKASGTGLERDMLRIRQELNQQEAERNQILEVITLDRLHHDMERGRLLRQIGKTQIEAGRVVLAPAAGIVARLNAKRGSASRPGQTLMTLYRQESRLEAWLYLPSDKAGQLRVGQAVQLRLDAYPHHMFGTIDAVVSEVSTIALLASDVAVPLPIKGPVFEVRASIASDSIEALGSTWPLAPGTSFQADVVRQRYRLYQWLLRSVRGEDDGGYTIAGS